MGYVKNNRLTEKGEFSSNIYSDEILVGEVFSTEFYKQLNEYQMLMIVACLCYEARERTEFYKNYPSHFVERLKKMLWAEDFFRGEKRFREIDSLTAIVHPCYHGRDLFKILESTSLLEGDVIRFLRQVIDKLSQIKSATQDRSLRDMLDNCQKLVNGCVKDFGIV